MWILDAGHGGMIDGKYTTCPNWTEDESTWHKMWVHDGVPIFEGVFNRLVVKQISYLLCKEDIPHVVLVGDEDLPLKTRVNRINAIHEKYPETKGISIHGNAFNGLAQGFEVFTSKGETASDPIAEHIAIEVDKEFTGQAMRWDLTDGDKDKEANFYILKRTTCPMVLSENFFFDNPDEAALMMSEEGIARIAKAHVKAIKQVEDGKDI
jgi:N-acetylmuramoyl-L-alanine amidase